MLSFLLSSGPNARPEICGYGSELVGRTRFELVTSSVSGKSRADTGVCCRRTESNWEPSTCEGNLAGSCCVRGRLNTLAPICGSRCRRRRPATSVETPPRDVGCRVTLLSETGRRENGELPLATRPELPNRSLATRTTPATLTTQIRAGQLQAGLVRRLERNFRGGVSSPRPGGRALGRGRDPGLPCFSVGFCCQAASVVVTVRVWSAKLATSSRCPPSAWT